MFVKEKSYKQKQATLFLDSLNHIAKRNATTACRGFMYEPQIPKKLLKDQVKH